MRHRKKFNHLGRKSAHRKETLSSLATSLILHKRINTTVAKAKALRVFVEPLITKSKVDSTHSRRTVFGYLRSKQAVSELFREVAQKVADRPGGYTRILKTGFRQGDSAEMCLIELVDYNPNMLKTEEDVSQKTTRRGRRRKSAEGKPADVKAAASKKEAAVADAAETREVTREAKAKVVEKTAAAIAEEPAAEVVDKTAATSAEEPAAEDAGGSGAEAGAEETDKSAGNKEDKKKK